jgi:hypothetical protein
LLNPALGDFVIRNLDGVFFYFSQIDKLQLSNYRKIIFHRPQYSFKLWRTIRTAQKNQIEHWVDFDDLLFCPELSNTSAAVQSGKMSASLAKKHAQRYLKALQLFTHCQVSTDALADELAKLKKYTIKVTYNKVPERWVKQADCIPAKERLQKKIIRYLPGTSHHKHDFAHVEEFLAQLLHDNPDYHLNIIGDLEFDTHQFPAKQISQTPFQPYEQLPSLINDSWVIIAPLVDNIFNRCKSGLKFWESGIFGIPVLSSPLKDIERFDNKGLCISDDLNIWRQYIKKMEESSCYLEASNYAASAANAAVIKQNNQTNYRHQYLINVTLLGPRWPGLLLNPTSKTQKSSTPIAHNLENKLLLKQAKEAIAQDTEPKSNVFFRKSRKLRNSPVQFFYDMYHK